VDGFNISEYLIDGAVICNDPTLFAYSTAKELDKEEDIIIMSLGTGFME